MAVIGQRHGGYKAGLLLFLCGMVAFIVGFATPYWYTYTNVSSLPRRKMYGGLWSICVEWTPGRLICMEVVEESKRMFEVVRALGCTALTLMLVCLLYALYANFLATAMSTARHLEIGLAVAGGLGLNGAIYFNLKLREDIHQALEALGDLVHFSFSWSFALAISGCALIILAAILIFIFNKQQHKYHLPTSHASSLKYTALMGSPKSPAGSLKVYTVPPLAYFANQVQGEGQGQAVQGQVLAPRVCDTPEGGQKQ